MNMIQKSVMVLAVFAGSIFAADMKPGVKVQAGLSGINGSDAENLDAGIMFAGGGTALIAMNEKLAIAPELLFSYNTYSSEFDPGFGVGTIEMNISQMKIDVPVMARFMATSMIYAEFGPQVSYLLSNTIEVDGESESGTDGMSTLDFGLALGAGAMVSEQIGVGVRYYYGLLATDEDGESETSYYQLGLNAGYYF